MSKLFIYYSLTGNGDCVADRLSDYGIDVRKIETKNKLPKIFFFKMLVGGFRTIINYKDNLYEYDKNIDKYDEIIIGSPIWNGSISCPINSLLSELEIVNTKVSFIFYSGSGTSPKATKIVNKKYNNPSIIDLREPLKNNDELDKLKVYEEM